MRFTDGHCRCSRELATTARPLTDELPDQRSAGCPDQRPARSGIESERREAGSDGGSRRNNWRAGFAVSATASDR
jgi:hypothetical protein